MSFRLPSQKKFKPTGVKVIRPPARKSSVPAVYANPPPISLAPGPSDGDSQASDAPVPGLTLQSLASLDESQEVLATPVTDSQIDPSLLSQSSAAPSGSAPRFREPSLPPPRRRAASPALSTSSRASTRVGGRPALIHAASVTPTPQARAPSASPAPAATDTAPTATTIPTLISVPVPVPVPVPISLSPPSTTPSASGTAPSAAPQKQAKPSRPPLPPSIASSFRQVPQTFGVPPTILSSSARAPTRSPDIIASADRAPTPALDPAALAAAVVADIVAAGPAFRPIRLTKKRVPRKQPVYKPRDPNAPPRAKRTSTTTTTATAKRRSAVKPGSDAAEEYDEGDELDDTSTIGDAPPPKKRGRPPRPPMLDEAGNPVPVRKATAKRAKARGPSQSEASKENRQPRAEEDGEGIPDLDLIGEDGQLLAPGELTMGDFATNLYDGPLSERAQRLRDHLKQVDYEKLQAKAQATRNKYMRLQPMRRKARSRRNEERAVRRVAFEVAEAAGEEVIEVSDDEVDSAEEYEMEPDRLTPPPSPGPDGMRNGLDGEEAEGQEDEEYGDEGEEEGDRAEDEEGPQGLFLPHDPDADAEDENAAEQNEDGQGEGEEGEDALVAAGFVIGPDRPEGDEGVGDDDQGDYDYYANSRNFGIDEYRANRDEQRRQILQSTRFRQVDEDDDETRMINSNSFGKRSKVEKWSDFETEFFYAVLAETGENYTMMKAWFPGRTVAQIKRKGLKENAKNPEKVTRAILSRKPIDKKYLTRTAGFDAQREWDKEDALFEEARADAAKLQAEDRGDDYELDEGDYAGAAANGREVEDEGEGEDEAEPGDHEEDIYDHGLEAGQ